MSLLATEPTVCHRFFSAVSQVDDLGIHSMHIYSEPSDLALANCNSGC